MATLSYSINAYSSGDILSANLSYQDTSSLLYYNQYKSYAKLKEVVGATNVAPRFRILTLNPDETVRGQIPTEDIIIGGSYQENYQNGQRRNLSFSLINDDGQYTPGVGRIWAGDKFALEIGLVVGGDLTDTVDNIVWFRKGTYVITQASPSHDTTQKTVSIECSDKFAIFEGPQGIIQETYEVPVGTDIKSIIKDIQSYMNGDGYMLDPLPMLYDPSFEGMQTPLTISENAGSTWGGLLTQLAEILSAEIFYNTEGRLVVTPIVEVTNDGDKPVLYDLDALKGDFTSDSMSFNMQEFVNKVVVIGSNVNGHTCMATAINNDPASPLCVQRIGYRMAAPINDSNITNDILAQERADYELRQKLIAKTTINTSIMFNPLLTVNNLVTLSDDFFELKRERFLIQSLSYSLDYSGTMSLTISNIKNLPFVS